MDPVEYERQHTLSFDEAQQALDEAASAVPDELFKYLNGGVVLLPDIKISPHDKGLYTLGTYHNQPTGLGRYITIYYGSFVQVYGQRPPAVQRRELVRVLRHELTHHIESLAGVRDLEVKDEIFLEKYQKNKQKNNG